MRLDEISNREFDIKYKLNNGIDIQPSSNRKIGFLKQTIYKRFDFKFIGKFFILVMVTCILGSVLFSEFIKDLSPLTNLKNIGIAITLLMVILFVNYLIYTLLLVRRSRFYKADIYIDRSDLEIKDVDDKITNELTGFILNVDKKIYFPEVQEIDNKDILTQLTAEKAKIGYYGYFGNTKQEIMHNVKNEQILQLSSIKRNDTDKRFVDENNTSYFLFLPCKGLDENFIIITYRMLSEWTARGLGEFVHCEINSNGEYIAKSDVQNKFAYSASKGDDTLCLCNKISILVRKFGDELWNIPTIEYCFGKEYLENFSQEELDNFKYSTKRGIFNETIYNFDKRL